MAITNEHINIDEILGEYFSLQDEVQELKTENDFLQRQKEQVSIHEQMLLKEITALKARCKELAYRNNELETEVADLRFTHRYLTSEEAGKRFAQELLGGV